MNRYDTGVQNLKKIDGHAGENVINSLKDIAPDLGTYIFEYPFGDIYNRKELSLRDRELATISMLAALGNAIPQLKVHIEGALNVGVKKQEIIEVFIQTSVYAGFPAAINAMLAAKEIFKKRGIL